KAIDDMPHLSDEQKDDAHKAVDEATTVEEVNKAVDDAAAQEEANKAAEDAARENLENAKNDANKAIDDMP
ncbi:hypothetical protein CK477_22820, partial [Enterobacter cloacae]